MKLRSLRIQTSPRLMIIPMIDIIFFLLVFFMISTLYMVEQRTLPVNLPQAVSAHNDLEKQVAITVMADGRIIFDQEEIPTSLVAARIKAELARRPEAAFVLRADRQAEYGRVVTVIDEMKRLGVRRVAIATEALSR